jgi:hypothetical protein
MSQKPDNYPPDSPPPERPKFDIELKIHVGIKPPEGPDDAPKGYALGEIKGGKGDDLAQAKPRGGKRRPKG